MNCWLIAIGNELLNGEVLDTNSIYLEKELLNYSIKITRVIIVPDEENAILSEIKRGINEAQYLFIIGGLGPTEDDLTRYAVSHALNRDLVQNVQEMGVISEKFRKFGHKMSVNNEKQSFFPEKAKILTNPIGTASGFYMTEKECHIFVLPGVPLEMKQIYLEEIIPILEQRHKKLAFLDKLTVKTIGIGESVLDSLIQEKIIPFHELTWEIIAKSEGVFIKFYPKEKQSDEVWKETIKKDLTKLLGITIYGFEEDDLGDMVVNLLISNGLTLGLVESCTGGYVSKYVTDKPGSSQYFSGSLITYSNFLKEKLAGVNPDIIKTFGSVSQETAEALAKGGKAVLGSDICLSITGIAGPTGETKDKPVGLVFFGLIDQYGQIFNKRQTFNGSREDIRRKSLFYGMNMIRLALEGSLDK